MKTLYFKLTLCFFLLLAGNATQGIWAQQEPIQIAGIVLDEHGDPLPGANISVKGKEKTGTITDMDGNFSMKSLAPKTTLIVSRKYWLLKPIRRCVYLWSPTQNHWTK